MLLSLPNDAQLSLDPPVIVGVLNVTPDSFSDGGRFLVPDAAVEHALQMERDGAGIIEIGGESTRPGSLAEGTDSQIGRIEPVIRLLRKHARIPICVDTTHSSVAQAALDAGACMINDVSAGRADPGMFDLAARRGVPIVLMHMRGEPRTMQDDPRYDDVAAEVLAFLLDRAQAAESAGIARDRIVIDPGIGFGKTLEHNLALLRDLTRFVQSGYPVMLGASRKRFLGEITGEHDPQRRDAATAATTALAVAAGVQLIRVHDVRTNRHAARTAFAVLRGTVS